jgi:hypothetical protein
MRPQKPGTTKSARLDQIINRKPELAQLAGKVDWDFIDGEIEPLYSENRRQGRRLQSGCCCSSKFTDCPTKVCASAHELKKRLGDSWNR